MRYILERRIELGETLKVIRALFLFVLLFGQASCAIQLAPPYDKQIVDTLVSASELAETEFAAVRTGAEASTFKAHEDEYSKIVGKLATAETLARVRPLPKGAGIVPLGSVVPSSVEEIPSVVAIEKLEDTVNRMRTKHQAEGLNVTQVQGYKGQFEIYMKNALTYEKGLER